MPAHFFDLDVALSLGVEHFERSEQGLRVIGFEISILQH